MGMDEQAPEFPGSQPGWLDFELPMHMQFELDKAMRKLPQLDNDALVELAEAALTHNFRLVNIARQSIERVVMLEELIEASVDIMDDAEHQSI